MKENSILLTLTALLLLPLGVLGQETRIEDFVKLRSSGPLPAIFSQSLQTAMDGELHSMGKDEFEKKRNQRNFVALSEYQLNRLLRSGNVLYGDPLTEYATEVLQKIDEATDDDLSDIQIVTLKSNVTNAFATHQGVVVLTTGLWGQIENEAQLAMIIAHEAYHVVAQHSLESYQHRTESSKKTFSEDVTNFYEFSKDHEKDADKAGFKMAIDAGYDADELFHALNILLYSYLPIDEVPVDYSWLETDHFKITDKYIMDEIDPISAEEDAEDEYSTHPNMLTRKENLEDLLHVHSGKSGAKKYVARSEAEFEAAQDLARFEMMNIFLRQADYIDGLYHNRILQNKYPNNKFLKETEAMLWYGYVAHEQTKDGQSFATSYRKKEGEIQQLYYFFSKVQDEDLAAIAVKEVWDIASLYPEDAFLGKIKSLTMNHFVHYDENRIQNFASDPPEDTDAEIEEEELSKYEKIQRKKKQETQDRLTYYALMDWVADSAFKASYSSSLEYQRAKEDEEEDEDEEGELQESNLNIRQVAFAQPRYTMADSRKTIHDNITSSVEGSKNLMLLINENAAKLDIDVNYINDFESSSFDTEAYNQYCQISDYLGERISFSGLDFMPFEAKNMEGIQQAIGGKYLGLIGWDTEIDRREFNGTAMVYCLLMYPLFPFYLKWQFTKDKSTSFRLVVYDLDSHDPEYIGSRYYKNNLKGATQKAHVYNILYQIVKK